MSTENERSEKFGLFDAVSAVCHGYQQGFEKGIQDMGKAASDARATIMAQNHKIAEIERTCDLLRNQRDEVTKDHFRLEKELAAVTQALDEHTRGQWDTIKMVLETVGKKQGWDLQALGAEVDQLRFEAAQNL